MSSCPQRTACSTAVIAASMAAAYSSLNGDAREGLESIRHHMHSMMDDLFGIPSSRRAFLGACIAQYVQRCRLSTIPVARISKTRFDSSTYWPQIEQLLSTMTGLPSRQGTCH